MNSKTKDAQGRISLLDYYQHYIFIIIINFIFQCPWMTLSDSLLV